MVEPAGGRLRHLVSFERPEVTLDSNGAATEDWVPCFSGATFGAEVMPLSGREMLLAAQVQSRVTARIRLRYLPGIDPAWRVMHGATAFNIEAVIADPAEGNRWLTLQVYTGTNEG